MKYCTQTEESKNYAYGTISDKTKIISHYIYILKFTAQIIIKLSKELLRLTICYLILINIHMVIIKNYVYFVQQSFTHIFINSYTIFLYDIDINTRD